MARDVAGGAAIIFRQAPSGPWRAAGSAASDRAWMAEALEPSLVSPPPSSADAVLFQLLFATTAALPGKLREPAGSLAHKHLRGEIYPRPAPRCRCRTCRRS